MSEYKTLLYEVEGPICNIILNRPKQGNAMEATLSYDELDVVFKKAAADESVKAVVLKGNGKHFCTGGDISGFPARIEDGRRLQEWEARNSAKLIQTIRTCPKPVIASIQGGCVGAGMSIALACDLRIMEESSFMCMAFIQVGLCSDTGGLFNLVHACGGAKALEYLMLGNQITAKEAYDFKLTSRVVPDGTLEEATEKLARRLAKGPTKAYEYQKRLMWDWLCQDYPVFIEEESTDLAACSRTDDFAEAVDAFLNKRKPIFKGK